MIGLEEDGDLEKYGKINMVTDRNLNWEDKI